MKPVENLEELKIRLAKHFWLPCLVDGKLDLTHIDVGHDFSFIPRNKAGKIELDVGELRTIIERAVDEAIKYAAEFCEPDDRDSPFRRSAIDDYKESLMSLARYGQ